MVERKIRWNMVTDTGEQIRLNNTYFFAILNEPREIMRIKQRLLEQVVHFDDFLILGDFGISGSNGLHCEIFSFSTDVTRIPSPSAIYQGNFRRDRNLYPREKGDFESYVENLSRS